MGLVKCVVNLKVKLSIVSWFSVNWRSQLRSEELEPLDVRTDTEPD
jgi:hypothetical protein